MKNMLMALLLHFFAFGIIGCASVGKKVVQAKCLNGIEISAKVEERARGFYFTENFSLSDKNFWAHGEVLVSNLTTHVQVFGTSHLMLSVNNLPYVRGYKMTLSTEAIDHTGIKVYPGEYKEFGMYWPLDLSNGEKLQNINLICNAM